MKKRIIIVWIVTICTLLFTIFVSAHSGKTDSNGGHYNHSTGEYHYHHGYSAHQHYDMDGDGIKDCPYDFKDKTNHNSGSSANNKPNSGTNTNKNTNTDQSKKHTWIDTALIIIKIIFISLLFLLFLCPTVVPVVYFLLSILIETLTKKLFKIELKESLIKVITISLIVIITLTIVTIVVLKGGI